MPEAHDPLTKIQLDMAEMKGMLAVVITNHSGRLDAHDLRIDTLRDAQGALLNKLTEQTVSLSNVDKQFINVNNEIDKNRTESNVKHDKDTAELKTSISDVEKNQSGQVAKAFQIITPIGGAVGLLAGLVAYMNGGGV